MDERLREELESGSPDGREEPVNLAGSARRGVAVTSGATAGRTALELITSVFLARLLEPSEFGIVAVAATFLGVSFIIGNLGVGIAVVQARTLEARDRNTAFFLAIGVGLGFTLLLSALGPVAASFFEMPVLRLAMPVMSLQILLSGAAATPVALLRRKLQFGRAASVDVVSSATYAVTSVGMALAGFGVWSLVWAPVAAGLAAWILAHALSRFVPRLSLSRAAARRLLAYGGTLTVKNVFVHISRHADKFIIGKLLGAHATGLYSRAFNWGVIPDMRLMPVLQAVVFPIFCRVRHERERFVEWYLKVTTLGAVAVVPLALGLMVLAEDFTVAAFGEKWRGIVPSLRILCLAGLLNSVNRLSGAAVEATGKLRFEVATQSVYAVLLPLGAILAVDQGIEGVAWAVLGATGVLFLLKGEAVHRTVGVPRVRYLGTLLPALAAGLMMAGAVYAILRFSALPHPAVGTGDHWLRLVVGSVAGALLYPAALFLVARRQLALLLDQLRQLWTARGRGGKPGGPVTVVVQSHSPWAESIYRGLYAEYARDSRVIFLHAEPGPWSLRGVLQTGRRSLADFKEPGLRKLRVSPVLPGSRLDVVASVNRWIALRVLLRYVLRHLGPRVVLITQQPLLLPTFRGLPALRVYDVIDDYVGLQLDERGARRVRKAHRRSLRECDVVWATAGTLVESIRSEREDVFETTNGVDYEQFSNAADGPVPERLCRLPKPRVGLIGRLNDRVDWVLLEKLCKARPDWSVVVVGPLYGPMKVTPSHLSRLERLANFQHLPAVPEEAIPAWIAGFDVCLIPYRPSGSNLSVNPLKLYQYLAVGRPVVATPLPVLRSFADVIDVRGDADGYIAAVETALQQGAGAGSASRRARARQFDWQAVAAGQLAVLAERWRAEDEPARVLNGTEAR